MQHPADAVLSCFQNHCPGVVFCVTRMHYHRYTQHARKLELPGERRSLLIPGRIIVVVIQPAFTDRDRAAGDMFVDCGNISRFVEADRIMRMHARGIPDEPRIVCRDSL